ncbi:c-type cytochrome [Thiohalomonas denitrificans]|uniref:c-type cytochrome n=1 Tax=Thiohalomonas denitrificans TaxID=415747 RepID=UPI0026F00868|nr:c-type cytochrome [Thiohalomonas denitrificans]
MKTTKRRLLLIAIGMVITTTGCVGPQFSAPTSDAGSGWQTEYTDALNPHTQLALGVLQAVERGDTIQNRARMADQWQLLSERIEAGADTSEVNKIRREIESNSNPALVEKAKDARYSRSDLMGFMISSGMKIPKDGISSLDPDMMAARQASKVLRGEDNDKEKFVIKSVPPEQILTPVENLTLGTAKLLAEDRDSFEMSQVFRLALYLRPLRRVYDPNPDLNKRSDQSKMEAIYMDRIWRTLKPEQIRQIREWNLTREDMEKYLSNHVQLFQVEATKYPTFALLEYAVNDFHEQIAPAVTIKADEKDDYFIPTTLTQLDGTDKSHGKKLFEGACAGCHGNDGQGRFPPIAVPSYLSLHSDHEHFHIVQEGPPQKPGSPIVMPTFNGKLTEDHIWAITKYIRSFESRNFTRRGEAEARAAGIQFYDTADVYTMWQNGQNGQSDRYFLDVQSDIAFRIMGHMPGSHHIRPQELDQQMSGLPRDKEIIVIDMFGSQGVGIAHRLKKAGYQVGYMEPGMIDWHINRNFPVAYN